MTSTNLYRFIFGAVFASLLRRRGGPIQDIDRVAAIVPGGVLGLVLSPLLVLLLSDEKTVSG